METGFEIINNYWISQKPNLIIVLLYIEWNKKSHVFASSLTATTTKCTNLTWLLLEIMHHGHTWHDYPWSWVSLTWLLYDLQLWHHRHWFQKFTAHFQPIRKEVVSSMYNNEHYVCRRLHFSSKESYFCPFLQTSHLPNYHQVTFQMSFLSLWTNGRLFLFVLFTTMLYFNNSNMIYFDSF